MHNADTQSISQRVLAAPFVQQPFPHIVVDDLLRPSEYRSLLRGVPRQLARQKYDGSAIRSWSKEWEAAATALTSESLKRASIQKFEHVLERKYARCAMRSLLERATIHVEYSRFLCTYENDVHTDLLTKVITIIFFVNEDEALADVLGTNLYKHCEGYKEISSKHLNVCDGFFLVERVPYQPNLLFSFAPGANTWHCVPALPSQRVTERGVILVNVVDDEAHKRVKLRLRCATAFTSQVDGVHACAASLRSFRCRQLVLGFVYFLLGVF